MSDISRWARRRYSLGIDGDVEEPTNQTNKSPPPPSLPSSSISSFFFFSPTSIPEVEETSTHHGPNERRQYPTKPSTNRAKAHGRGPHHGRKQLGRIHTVDGEPGSDSKLPNQRQHQRHPLSSWTKAALY